MSEPAAVDRPVRIGVDIGGTFTDLMLVDDESGEIVVGKTLTTPADPSVAVEQQTAEALRQRAAEADSVRMVVHGTTLVTNAIIERTGDPTALLTTAGFRDALEIRREHRYDMYDLFLEPPRTLIPRNLRLEVDERVLADGTVLRPLDRDQVAGLVRELDRRGIRALAVCFLHSYKNPAHERQVAEIVEEIAPGMQLSLSSELVPEIKEYERTSTTACNVYVKSLVDRYLAELERKLQGLGIRGELYVMLSSGGIATVETSRRFPIRLLESGPAAGALATAHLGRLAGYRDLFSFDMGGTTAKLCVIEDGEPLTSSQFEVDRVYRFKKGSGLPVKIPVIEMIEIGAGGGSVAHIDSLGLLKVGPHSAAADPGPACYGRGGTAPTVTDADLALGYLDPDFFLGGRMRLDPEAARRAVEKHVAVPLGMDVDQAAWGIHQIVNENMANAARIHAIERGKDPRAFPVFAFGGAGPVHAWGVASILHSPSVIAPLGAGVGSTIGFLTAPLSFDFVRTSLQELEGLDWTHADAIFAEMEAEGGALLEGSGLRPHEIVVSRSADVRYVGQGQEVRVPIPDGDLGPESLRAVTGAFEDVYRRLFGRLAAGVPLEVVNWRVVLRGPRPALDLGRRAAGTSADAGAARKGERPAFFPDAGGFRRTPVYDRYRLGPGAELEGPAIVEERESTVVLGPAAVARIDDSLNLIARLPDGR